MEANYERGLETEIDPDNVMDKYAVCGKENSSIVGHLALGKNKKFAKMIFYLLKAEQDAERKLLKTGKEVNLGDGDGMQVSCKLKISGSKKWWQYFVKIFNVVQKRANKKLLLCYICKFSSIY